MDWYGLAFALFMYGIGAFQGWMFGSGGRF